MEHVDWVATNNFPSKLNVCIFNSNSSYCPNGYRPGKTFLRNPYTMMGECQAYRANV